MTDKKDAGATKGGGGGWSSVLLWFYMGICALVLAMHATDTAFKIRSVKDEQVPEVVDDVLQNHPAEISESWATDEILRLRKFGSWMDLHTVPVVLWLILSFLQVSPSFRRSNINRHMLLGQVMLVTSSIMILGIGAMLVRGERIYGGGFDLSNPFTFSTWSVVGGLWWIYCGAQGYRQAATRSIHKWYMYHFLANGYCPGTARLIIFAYMLIKYPKGGPNAMDTPELHWLVDVSAWASFILNIVGAEICLRWTASAADNTAQKAKNE